MAVAESVLGGGAGFVVAGLSIASYHPLIGKCDPVRYNDDILQKLVKRFSR